MVGVKGERIARPGEACVSMSPIGLSHLWPDPKEDLRSNGAQASTHQAGPGGEAEPGRAVLGGLIPPPVM